MGELLAGAVNRAAQDQSTEPHELAELILPVPIHQKRLLQRGFNQAEVIAQTVARRLQLPLDTKTLCRSKHQLSQSRLSAVEREKNIRRAFTVEHYDQVQGKQVAVIDDVYTTGATARAVARQLKKAGASKISIWAVARAP